MKQVITIEENYSQSKRYHRGIMHSTNATGKGNDGLKPTPNKSMATSNSGSNQKPVEKAAVVIAKEQSLQNGYKPSSIKLEQ